MIFQGYLELIDINMYRRRSLDRKMKYYRNSMPEKVFYIKQLEWEILECIERVRESQELPFIDVIEVGDASEIRRNPTKTVPEVSCTITKDNRYLITYDWHMAVKLGRYIGFIFEKPWTKQRIDIYTKDGIEYKKYEKSLYEFSKYKKFDVCKKNLSDYIRKISLWFIALHELAHIKNGHLDLKRDIQTGKIKVDVDTFRALEIHADLTAAHMLLNIMEGWQKYVGISQPVHIVNGKNPGITYCDELTFAVLAVYISLRCALKSERWDEYTVKVHEMLGEKHPLTELRIAIIFNFFLQGLIDLGENDLEKTIFADNLYQSIIQFEDFLFQNEAQEDENRLYYMPTELLRTEIGKMYYHKIFNKVIEVNSLLINYTNNPTLVEGQWTDYETLPERMYWSLTNDN